MRQALAFAVLFFLGCGDERTSTQLAPSPMGPIWGTYQEVSLGGRVEDTAFRPLGGVRLEVVDGPRAGTSATTDAAGQLSMPGTFAPGTITLTASKDGFRSSTKNFTITGGQERAWAFFRMEPTTPSMNLAGEYLLTLTADSSCTNLPAEVRTRSYRATITRTQTPTFFQGKLSGATFVGEATNSFYVGVAGDFASFGLYLSSSGPSIVESLGETGYLSIAGEAEGVIGASGITAPLDAFFEFCPRDQVLIFGADYIRCKPVTTVCNSRHHRLTLTPW